MRNLAAVTRSMVLPTALACLALASSASAQVTFAPQAVYPVGDFPTDVAVGDFNDDGEPDLAVSNELDYNADMELTGTVSILLGGPAGGFGAQTAYEVPYPRTIAVADFNGDGDPDLATAHDGFSSGMVSIVPGGAAGSFGSATSYAVGDYPKSMAIADFNADGDPDIAVPNFGSSTLSVLLGGQAAAFGAQTTFATDLGPYAAVTADFNDDGDPDLATANSFSDDVSVFLGQAGSGGFSPKATYAAGNGAIALAAGDFNADGDPDLAVADEQAAQISVLLGTTGGTFAAPAHYPTDAGPVSVEIADLNADGNPDLAVGHDASDNISVLLGAAGGTFGASTEFPAGADPVSVAVADVNLDGRPDLVTGNRDDDTVSVLLNTTTATTPTPPQTTITGGPAGTTADSTPTFSFTSDKAGSTFECRMDTAAFAPCSSPLTTATLVDGAHTFEVRATADALTDATPAVRAFTVDTAPPPGPPETTITGGPTGSTDDSTPTFTFTSSSPNSTFHCRVDGSAFVSCSSPYTILPQPNGPHTFEVRALSASNQLDFTPAKVVFTVAVPPPPGPPETTITGGPTGPTDDPTPTYTFTSSAPDSRFHCRVDGSAFVSCISPYTILPQALGPHTFEVRALDTSNQLDMTPAKVVFSVEAPAPTPTPTPSPTPSPTPTPSPGPGPSTNTDDEPPVVSVLVGRGQTVASLLKRGLSFKVTSDEAAGISTRLSVGKRSSGQVTARLAGPGTRDLILKLTRAQRSQIKRAQRSRIKRGATVTATLRVVVADAAGNTTELKRTVRFKR